MTISNYILSFLKRYENIKIETNHLADGSDHNGLFKSPARDIQRFDDGSYVISEYYNFLAFNNSMSETERQEDDEWLENLIYWVDDYEIVHNGYPPIDGNRRIVNIDVNGCPYPYTDNDKGITYQISLKITYEREVND